jgi:hypothetical protein
VVLDETADTHGCILRPGSVVFLAPDTSREVPGLQS